MSDSSISIVCKKSRYPNSQAKAQEILEWLIANDIVDLVPSDCALGSESGHAVSKGARSVVVEPKYLSFGPEQINGVSIIAERTIFNTGQNGIEELTCPNCKNDISQEDWDFFDPWASGETDDLTCPSCGRANEIHDYAFKPEWGFSNLGFEFWNWPPFTDQFIKDFKLRLGCDVNIVFSHI
jgi:hypothetical protein